MQGVCCQHSHACAGGQGPGCRTYSCPRQPSLLPAPHLHTYIPPAAPQSRQNQSVTSGRRLFKEPRKCSILTSQARWGRGWGRRERGSGGGAWGLETPAEKEPQQTHGDGAEPGHLLSRAPGPKGADRRPHSPRDSNLDLGAPQDASLELTPKPPWNSPPNLPGAHPKPSWSSPPNLLACLPAAFPRWPETVPREKYMLGYWGAEG